MRLGSARELKVALRDAILDGMADALRREGGLITAASRAPAAPPAAARTLALGISAAVRGTITASPCASSAAASRTRPPLGHRRKRARGEVDVRYVGRIAKQARRAAAAREVPWHQSAPVRS